MCLASFVGFLLTDTTIQLVFGPSDCYDPGEEFDFLLNVGMNRVLTRLS